MNKFVIEVPDSGGIIKHEKVDTELMNLADDAEVYDNRGNYRDRLRELQTD